MSFLRDKPDSLCVAQLPPKWTELNTKAVVDWDGQDPIEMTLRGDSREKYLESVSEEVRSGLVEGLKRTVRWSNGGQVINPNFQESNLEHVIELLEWCNEMEDFYPALWEEICDGKMENGDELRTMLTIHDIGEMHPKLGDMCVSNPNRGQKSGILHKRKESFAAHLMLGKFLEEPHRSDYRHLYHRFEKRADGDKMSLLGHMFDKGQASQNVALHVIPFSIGSENYDVEANFYGSQTNTLKYADKLWDQLKNPEAKRDLRSFLSEKVVQHFFAIEFPLIQVFTWKIREKFAKILL